MAVIIGALLVGLITGAVPAICGAIKGKIGMGLIGFAACTVAGLILGLLLAIPVCAVFVYLIFKESSNSKKATGRVCLKCGCMIEENAAFCQTCGSPVPRI